MKNEMQIREALIENTIYLIAQGGFERATTRNIAQCKANGAGLITNDAYIYRIFGSKESLYAEAFCRLNDEFLVAMCRRLDRIKFGENSLKEDLYFLWQGIWNFLLRNELRCRCYTRYYYSIYFKEESLRHHRESFNIVVRRMKHLFKDEADVDAILHNMMTTMLNFAIRVYNGDLANCEKNAKHIFNTIWCGVAPYLKET